MPAADGPVPQRDGGEGRPSPLRNRNFAVYWWGGMLSGPGTWLHNVTASVLVLDLTGSPFMVGVVNFATFIPLLLFSLPAGSLGDRFDRRRVVVVACASAGVLAAALTVLSATGRLTPELLVLFCFLLGTAAAINKPAHSALLATLVPRADVPRATALNVLQFQSGQVLGPGLASLILLVGTPAHAFGLNAVSFLGPVVSMLLLRLPPPAVTPPAGRRGGGARGSMAAGLAHVRRSPTMPAVLVTVVLTNGAVEALRTLAPTIAAGLDLPEAAGVVIMGYSVGALIGLMGFGVVERRLPPASLLTVAFLLQLAGLVAVALAPGLTVTVLAAVPIGLGFSISTPLLSATLQTAAPEEYRSRVMAAFSMAHLGMRPFFALAAGGLATVASTDLTLGAFALIAALAVLYVRRRRVAYP